MDDIRPLFFATQVTPDLRRPQTQQIRSKIRNNYEDEKVLSPFQKLKRNKEQIKKVKQQYFRALSQNHRLQLSVNKLQKKKHTTRAEFIKVYGNLKYKKFLQQSRMQNQSRSKSMHQQRFDRTKKKKLQEQLQHMLTKNQQQQKIQLLQKKNKRDKSKISQIKSKAKEQVFSWAKTNHDMIKSHHTQFVIRKSNISTILQERSRLNYIKKINKELSLLKEYENVIDEIGEFNIDEINKLTQTIQIGKGYETFFMTTKNTIS